MLLHFKSALKPVISMIGAGDSNPHVVATADFESAVYHSATPACTAVS